MVALNVDGKHFTEQQVIPAVFLDVTKAFDRVRSDELVTKMNRLEFPTKLIQLLASVLEDRILLEFDIPNRPIEEEYPKNKECTPIKKTNKIKKKIQKNVTDHVIFGCSSFC